MHIDLNCDIEWNNDICKSLIGIVTSCNIACGGHAGNPESIREILNWAAQASTNPGAHPSYPDRAGFGRRTFPIHPAELRRSIRQQVDLIAGIAQKQGTAITHIKPHGALYNLMFNDENLGLLYLDSIRGYKDITVQYLQCGSIVARLAREAGFRIFEEAFIDRRYHEDKSLVSRSSGNAVIDNPDEVLIQLISLVEKGMVISADGKEIRMNAQSFCLHSDNPNSLKIAEYLKVECASREIFFKELI